MRPPQGSQWCPPPQPKVIRFRRFVRIARACACLNGGVVVPPRCCGRCFPRLTRRCLRRAPPSCLKLASYSTASACEVRQGKFVGGFAADFIIQKRRRSAQEISSFKKEEEQAPKSAAFDRMATLGPCILYCCFLQLYWPIAARDLKKNRYPIFNCFCS